MRPAPDRCHGAGRSAPAHRRVRRGAVVVVCVYRDLAASQFVNFSKVSKMEQRRDSVGPTVAPSPPITGIYR
jgi:hypothetical protein